MRPVILIGSCCKFLYQGYHEAILETWAADCGCDFFFMLGNTTNDPRPKADHRKCVKLPCADDYKSIAHKTREGHRWALNQGYDFIFQAWADTYIRANKLLASGFEKFHYVGHFRGEDKVQQLGRVELGCYASGGSGYWTSPELSRRIVQEEPDHWAEDLWVGRVSKKYGLQGTQDYRYFSGGGWTPEALTVHLSRGTSNYQPQLMRDTHAVIQRKEIK